MKNYLVASVGRFVIIFGSINFLLFIVGASSFGQEIELPDDPLAGQKVFVNKGCVKCHSIFGNGGKVGRDLGKTQVQQGPTGIFAMMWNHSPEMSELMKKLQKMPVFSGQEMADLIAYFYFLSYLDEQGEAEKGEIVLREKKCLTCHKVGGEGGEIGPPLDEVGSHAHPLSLAQAMWNHGSSMSATMSARGVQRPEFTGSEIIDLFARLREISAYETDPDTYLTPGKPTVGERVFEEKGCPQCHKIGNRGKAVGPDLTRVEFHIGVTRIAANMWNHGAKMWEKMKEMEIERPIFKENEMADLVAYLYFLNFIEQSGDVEAGKMLFTKKGCVRCHSIRGDGGNVGPDLALSEETKNYIKTTTAMWNHNVKMRILMDKMGMAMPRFNEKEMRDLLFFLTSERMKHE